MMQQLEKIISDKYFKFDLCELICQHTYERYIIQLGWDELRVYDMFDIRVLETLLFIRKELGRPITINNWSTGGRFDERGIRCHLCDLVSSKSMTYLSPHVIGKGLDFDVAGMTAEEVRQWLESNAKSLLHPIRVEDGKSWVHLDVHTYRPLGFERQIVYRLIA
jgi:hypothetical protein